MDPQQPAPHVPLPPGAPELRPAPAWTDLDRQGMAWALEEARRARELDEVPIGAVLLDADGRLLGRGHNRTRTDVDPSAHAEVQAIRAAAAASGAPRLPGALLYTTVEPCFMCAGLLIHARVARVVWGTRDPKFGGCASLGAVLDHPGTNHRARWDEGLSFFREKRRAARGYGAERAEP
ncbi:MAG: nucleoside deaminase [Planctomycetota bacterium]|jgi:tRNA(adenine34) deaminase